MSLGRVEALWRYPVKSMGGERIERGRVVPVTGLAGDRGWALLDEAAGAIRGAKQLHPLLLCEARYLETPEPEGDAPVEITLPDGTRLRGGEPDLDDRLSELVGRRVALVSRRPASDLDFFRRREAIDEAGLRAQLGLLPEEPLPDMSGWPPEMLEFTSPPGTYFDTFELHLLTRSSMATLARHTPGVRAEQIDARRFRPNLVVDCPDSEGLPETRWVGRELEIGNARLEVVMPVVRCVMTTCAQPGLEQAPAIMRSLVRETGQDLGVGLRVVEAGEIRVGDAVRLR